MAVVKYIWKGSSGAEDESPQAQLVGERLAAIEREHGQLKAGHVVDDARSQNSVLHKYFEWDDTKAAHGYRLVQARQLIAKVCVKRIDDAEVKVPTRAFVNLIPAPDADKTYENIVSVMSDEMKRQRLLARAREELNMWRKRYDHLNEFSAVFQVIDRTVAA